MIEAYEFTATSMGGEPVTLVAYLQFNAYTPPSGETSYLLGPVELSTGDGRAVNYVSGKFVSQEGGDVFTTEDLNIFSILAMRSCPASS